MKDFLPTLPENLNPSPAVLALRQAGIEALSAVLDRRLPGPPPIAALAHWVAEAPVSGPLPKRVRRALGRMSVFGALEPRTPLETALAARGLSRRFPVTAALQGLRGLAIHLIPRRKPRGLAAAGQAQLAPALLQTAWGDGSFRLEIARRAGLALRSRVILSPGEPPVVFLSVPTLLVLILAGSDPVRDPVTRALQDLARDLSAQEGWAGFWDQWLLAEAKSLGGWLPEAAYRLPLLLRTLADDPEQDPPQVEKDWKISMPPYCAFMVDGIF